MAPSYHTVSTNQQRTAEARAANAVGLVHAEASELHRAAACFRDAIALEPAYAAAHNNLGLTLFKQGQVYEAALEFNAACDLSPDSAEPLINLARLYAAVGWAADALEAYERALERQPDNPELIARTVRLYHRSGRHPERARALLARLMSDYDEEWTKWAVAESGQSSEHQRGDP